MTNVLEKETKIIRYILEISILVTPQCLIRCVPWKSETFQYLKLTDYPFGIKKRKRLLVFMEADFSILWCLIDEEVGHSCLFAQRKSVVHYKI